MSAKPVAAIVDNIHPLEGVLKCDYLPAEEQHGAAGN